MGESTQYRPEGRSLYNGVMLILPKMAQVTISARDQKLQKLSIWAPFLKVTELPQKEKPPDNFICKNYCS